VRNRFAGESRHREHRIGGHHLLRSILLTTTLGILAVLAAGAETARAQDVAAGAKDFIVCRACHQIGPTAKNGVGPVLNGVVGRPAGTYPGFSYSDANKNSGITWTADKIDTYLVSPKTLVPGTKMIFPGIPDPQKRKDIIAFLEQYGSDGQKKP
jgi:cytochrome c